MGVDCKIMLPHNVALRDVADVIGILSGVPKEKLTLNSRSHPGARYVAIPNVVLESCGDHLPQCANIIVEESKLSDAARRARGDNGNPFVIYHFEPSGFDGRLLLPRSTAYWIAVGRGLVRFFGGKLVYSDCDGRVNYSIPAKSRNSQ